MRVFYTALFKKDNEGYSITFPALADCAAEGKNFKDAYENAQDTLGHYILECEKKNIAFPVDIPSKEKNSDNTSALIVSCELNLYRKKELVEVCMSITEWKYLRARTYYHFGDLSELFEEGLREHITELKKRVESRERE